MTTPSDWLLIEQFDARPRKPAGSVGYVRPLMQIADDHALDECHIVAGSCRNESGAASWPEPFAHHRLHGTPTAEQFPPTERPADAI